jgi:hypothetical protein
VSTATGLVRPSVTGATEALDGYLAHQGSDLHRPPLRYLRRKPGRGLVAVFGPGDRGDIYTVTVAETALTAEPGDSAAASGPTVQQFPMDPQLAHLDAVMAPAEHPSLRDVLELTARRFFDVDAGWQLVDIAARPVRYKPGDRCVLRYRLRFADPSAADTASRSCTLVAKLYREQQEADAAAALLTRLHDGPAAGWTARSLGVVPGLPLALTEDLGSSKDAVPTRSGLDGSRRGRESGQARPAAGAVRPRARRGGTASGQPGSGTTARAGASGSRPPRTPSSTPTSSASPSGASPRPSVRALRGARRCSRPRCS